MGWAVTQIYLQAQKKRRPKAPFNTAESELLNLTLIFNTIQSARNNPVSPPGIRCGSTRLNGTNVVGIVEGKRRAVINCCQGGANIYGFCVSKRGSSIQSH